MGIQTVALVLGTLGIVMLGTVALVALGRDARMRGRHKGTGIGLDVRPGAAKKPRRKRRRVRQK